MGHGWGGGNQAREVEEDMSPGGSLMRQAV